mgnify:CR=1 FL=1
MTGRPLFVRGRGAVSAFGAGLPALCEGVFQGACALRPPLRLAGIPDLPAAVGELPAGADGPEEALALGMSCRAGEEALAGWGARAATALVLCTAKAAQDGGRGEGPGRLAAAVAARLGLGGPRLAVSTACASGLSGLALAGRWLRAGRAAHALVLGVDALTPFVARGFVGLLALDPGPCRPFDRARRGLSLGEGAGALLLSGEPGPGAPLRLLGWGEANDANHVTGPRRDGGGLRLAAERALARAGLAPDALDTVHLHGTATPYNDAAEALALRDLCGGPTPPAWGSKAALGHTLGASGVLETLLLGEALLRGLTGPNLRLEEPDVDPALRLVRGPTPLRRARVGLKVSAGFGGIDAAVLLGRD